VYKLTFCTFIFAVLLVKWRFPTVGQLQRYLAINILQSQSWPFGIVTFKWQQGFVVVELDWPHSIARPTKPPIRCKYPGDLWQNLNYSPFVSNFVAMATRVIRGKILLAVLDGPTPKTSYRCKDLANISSRSQAVAHFVPNFIAMATK